MSTVSLIFVVWDCLDLLIDQCIVLLRKTSHSINGIYIGKSPIDSGQYTDVYMGPVES